ncbi:hypothetical protein ACOMHN_050114 [Nucella lapillus]
MNREVEHPDELLSRPSPQDPPDIQPADSNLPTDCSPPLKEEICKTIKHVTNSKSAGPDNIPAKANNRTSVVMLYQLFGQI